MKSLVLAAGTAALVAAHAQAAPTTYSVDPKHTSVIFEISHFATPTNRGRWQAKEGSVQLDTQGKAGQVEVTLDVGSINTGIEAFDKHLRGKDFFDTAQYPTAKFSGNKFTFDGEKVREVSGMLTMLGKTHPVTLTATRFNCYQNPMLKRQVCGGDFESTIERSKWGMTWGSNMGVPDTVHLLVQIEAIEQ